MAELALWLEGSAPSLLLQTTPWLYPLVNLGHVLGLALLFGAVAALDLRLIGLWRAVPVAALARPLVPVAAFGLALALPTGALLFTVKAVEYAVNPFLFIKLAAVALGLLTALAFTRSAAWRAALAGTVRPAAALAGAASLLCWLTAIAAGRMIGYW